MGKNLLRTTAGYFDVVNKPTEDIGFYLDLAGKAPGPILELGCGTGRVTIPLVEAGRQVWGVDLSGEMLAVLERKAEDLPGEARERLHVFHDDMCEADLGRTFGLVIAPYRVFQALARPEQQKRCLENVRRHLSTEGRFVMNVFRPWGQLDDSWKSDENVYQELTDPRTDRRIRCAEWRKDIDVENQVIYVDLILYVEQPDGSETRLVEPLILSYFYEGQMRDLLVSSGFQIHEEMGSYAGAPISEGPELIFVCSLSN